MQSEEFRRLAQTLKSNLSRLMEQRSTWESHWQECADFMQPRKAEITRERARGDKENEQEATNVIYKFLMQRLFTLLNYWQHLCTEC